VKTWSANLSATSETGCSMKLKGCRTISSRPIRITTETPVMRPHARSDVVDAAVGARGRRSAGRNARAAITGGTTKTAVPMRE
jgi:hypothetical protein